MENREAVLGELEKASGELERVKGLLAEGDEGGLHEWLLDAKKKRDGLC
ncbi:MAG: hypothetical protein AAGC74_05770 [Verrucomicrobiota bacterium]